MPRPNRQGSAPEHPLGGFADHHQCCRARAFSESGCKIVMPGQPEAWICLSGTSYQDQHSFTDMLGDFLLAWERTEGERLSAVIEMKSGSWNVSDVHRQLQNGAVIIDDLLKGIDVSFLPALVHSACPPSSSGSFRGTGCRFAAGTTR